VTVAGNHVVIGAGGGTGSAVVRELAGRGLQVRAVTRSGKGDVPDGVEQVAADVGTGRQFLELLFEEAGRTPKIGVASRPVIRVGGLFDPLPRELNETLYQFERPSSRMPRSSTPPSGRSSRPRIGRRRTARSTGSGGATLPDTRPAPAAPAA
jgi:hypothetical protein